MKLIAVTAVVMSLFAATGAARADYRTIDELAFALERQTASVAREVYYHHRHAPDFRHLYSDAYEMHQLAKHIHEIAHDGDSLRHIRDDVEEIDNLFHHFEELVGGDVLPPPGVGRDHFHGHGRGLQGARLSRLMRDVEHTLHELQAIVEGAGAALPPPVPTRVVPVAPPVRGPLLPTSGRRIFQTRAGGISFSLMLK